MPEGCYQVRLKRLAPVMVPPAVGEITWLQLLSIHQDSGDEKALNIQTDKTIIQPDKKAAQDKAVQDKKVFQPYTRASLRPNPTTLIALKIQANAALHQRMEAISVVAEQILPNTLPVNNQPHAMEVNAVSADNPSEHHANLTPSQRDNVFTQSSNPAAQFAWLAQGSISKRRCRIGGGLIASLMDWDALHTWGRWCTQQQLTCKVVFDQPKTVWQQLEVIARCGHAKPVWDNGKLSVLIDRHDVPVVQTFDETHILLNSLTIEHRPHPSIHEVIVRFVNQDKEWQHDEVRVLANNATPPITTHTLELLGVTSHQQAIKEGQHYLAHHRSQWHYQWQSPTSTVCAKVGDVVQLACSLNNTHTQMQLTQCVTTHTWTQLQATGLTQIVP